jgi:hypothetical protein
MRSSFRYVEFRRELSLPRHHRAELRRFVLDRFAADIDLHTLDRTSKPEPSYVSKAVAPPGCLQIRSSDCSPMPVCTR